MENIVIMSLTDFGGFVVIKWNLLYNSRRLRGLVGSSSSNLDVVISEGCFIFDFAPLLLEVARSV